MARLQDLLGELSDAAIDGATRGAVSQFRSVTVRSQLSPPVRFKLPGAPGGGGGGAGEPSMADGIKERLLELARPEVILETAAGNVSIAPKGSPVDARYWPVVKTAGAVVAVAAVYGSYKLATSPLTLGALALVAWRTGAIDALRGR